MSRQRLYFLRFTFYAVLPLLFLFEHFSAPLPQSDMRLPPAYRLISADPGEFTVLDIPFAWRNGFRLTGAFTPQFMFGQFYQTYHQKRMLQGNTSRNPEFKFQYFVRAPIINSLLALETGKNLPPERWAADRTSAAAVLDFFNIRYIIVRPAESHPIGHLPQATMPYIEDIFPVTKIHRDETMTIYRVHESRPQETALKISSSDPLAPLYFGEGWGLIIKDQPIAAQRQETRLLLPLTAAAQRITIKTRLPDFAGNTAQTISLELNDWQSAPQSISKEWQEITFTVPAGIAQNGLNDLWLHFDKLIPLAPIPPRRDVTVVSAGEEVGGFAHIFVNGHDVSPNQRGYNVALIQSKGQIRTAGFDTFNDPTASSALAKFIQTAPPDALIAVAVADEASTELTEEAGQALHAIGATGNLRGCFRCSHALLSPPAQDTPAQESLDSFKPVGITTDLGLTEPNIAAEIEWIRSVTIEEQGE